MRTDWLTLTPPTLDYPTLATKNTVSVLDDCALLMCSGIDSAKFLQGQLTCNLQDITPSQTRLGAHCTPKGRMAATFQLAQTDTNDYVLRTHRDTVEPLKKALAKYMVFSNATLRHASDDFLQLGISGQDAQAIVERVFGEAPLLHNTISKCADGFVWRVTDAPRFECWIHAACAQRVWQQLSGQASPTCAHYWQWLNIRDGLGCVRAETIEEFIPQMLNLQLLDGISFTKGCYTGQEIVARMQYRGTLKKAMYRFAGAGAAPVSNTPIYLVEQNQAIGNIVIAEAISDAKWEALAVVSHDAIEQPLHMEDGTKVHVLPIPYTVLAK